MEAAGFSSVMRRLFLVASRKLSWKDSQLLLSSARFAYLSRMSSIQAHSLDKYLSLMLDRAFGECLLLRPISRILTWRLLPYDLCRSPSHRRLQFRVRLHLVLTTMWSSSFIMRPSLECLDIRWMPFEMNRDLQFCSPIKSTSL